MILYSLPKIMTLSVFGSELIAILVSFVRRRPAIGSSDRVRAALDLDGPFQDVQFREHLLHAAHHDAALVEQGRPLRL